MSRNNPIFFQPSNRSFGTTNTIPVIVVDDNLRILSISEVPASGGGGGNSFQFLVGSGTPDDVLDGNDHDVYLTPSPGGTSQTIYKKDMGVWNVISNTNAWIISQFTNDSGYLTTISGLNISSLTNDSNYVPAGGNISVFTNDSGYLTSVAGQNISQFTNDSGYLTTINGLNISSLTNDSNYVPAGGNISQFTNDANYITAGGNISQFTNDSGYLTTISGLNISQLTNDSAYTVVGSNISQFTNDAGYLTSLSGNISSFTNDSGYLTTITGINISQLTNDSGFITGAVVSDPLVAYFRAGVSGGNGSLATPYTNGEGQLAFDAGVRTFIIGPNVDIGNLDLGSGNVELAIFPQGTDALDSKIGNIVKTTGNLYIYVTGPLTVGNITYNPPTGVIGGYVNLYGVSHTSCFFGNITTNGGDSVSGGGTISGGSVLLENVTVGVISANAHDAVQDSVLGGGGAYGGDLVAYNSIWTSYSGNNALDSNGVLDGRPGDVSIRLGSPKIAVQGDYQVYFYPTGITSLTLPTVGTLAVANGVIDASNAVVGMVGEVISDIVSSGFPIGLVDSTPKDVLTINLSAGDWIVSGNINFNQSSATVTAKIGGLSLTTATLPNDGSESYNGNQIILLTAMDGICLTPIRVNITTTTTVYLVAFASFSAGTVSAFGSITATRRR